MRNPFVFATMVCVVCSVALAVVASTLRERQEYNVAIDQKKNILMALELFQPENKVPDSEIENIYSEKVLEKVIDKKGQILSGKSKQDVVKGGDLLLVYERKDNNFVAMPVEGMGLWSLLQGYFALKADRKTVAGITFYAHKETPGLGAEITQDWFTSNFKEKSILNSKGELVAVSVVKGKAADQSVVDLVNAVDGISGATMTGRGVTNLLRKGMESYKPFLSQKW